MADYFKGASALVVAGWIHIKDASSGEDRGRHHGDTLKGSKTTELCNYQ